jgi:hypothetical protein|tara:strand:+ start:2113 stop:2514 length:402 start_codon:yes stop_codon:yes gene_type:complete
MASIFCPECGGKNSYTLKRPNFCQSCGETFAAFGMSRASVSEPSLKVTAEEDEETPIPNLSKLEYDIDMSASATKITLEDLVNNPLNPKDITYKTTANAARKRMTQEEFLKVSQAECATSQGKSRDVSGGETK